jgi:hypothetical protein
MNYDVPTATTDGSTPATATLVRMVFPNGDVSTSPFTGVFSGLPYQLW